MTEQKERLKKLYALALRGVGGEKEQAQAILDKLLKKYAMTLDDLDDCLLYTSVVGAVVHDHPDKILIGLSDKA